MVVHFLALVVAATSAAPLQNWSELQATLNVYRLQAGPVITGVAAVVTMRGVFSSLTTGIKAIATGLRITPITASTLSSWTSFLNAADAFLPSPPESSKIPSSFLPRTPPAALISSIANLAPWLPIEPWSAIGPETTNMKPIFMESAEFAAEAARKSIATAKITHRFFISLPFNRFMRFSSSEYRFNPFHLGWIVSPRVRLGLPLTFWCPVNDTVQIAD